MNEVPLSFWLIFNLGVLVMLALDLGVFHRKAKAVSVKEALIWSAVWISLAMLFNVWVKFQFGPQGALEFLTGYLIEKSLSIDNIFVFVLIFGYFKVAPEHQHRVLFWGILGALAMRAILILVGAALIQQFHWIIYIFGGFLIYTGIRMAVQTETNIHPESNPLVKFFKRFMPVTPDYHGSKFFITQNGQKFATPLLVVLIIVEFTDLVFAVDSIPAIFAITQDSFIVYTSNVFAILGLRSLYFALAGIIDKFHYLKLGLAVVLIFVGIKMTIVDFYKIPIALSLIVVASIISFAVIASLIWPKKK